MIYVGIVILYSLIQAFEFLAVLARLSGVVREKPLLGYSIQQVVYMGTRFLLVLMVPLLGYVVDTSQSIASFREMIVFSVLISGLAGIIIHFFKEPIVFYFDKVMHCYAGSNSFLYSFYGAFLSNQKLSEKRHSKITLHSTFNKPGPRRIAGYSLIVFTVYSIGLFLAFYFSLLIPERRVMLSQMSGVFTAIGALLLSLVIEPKISLSIDSNDNDAPCYVMAMFYGRLIALLVVSQILLAIVFSLSPYFLNKW